MERGLELELNGFTTGRIPGGLGVVVPVFGSAGASVGVVSVGTSNSGESAISGAGAGTRVTADSGAAADAGDDDGVDAFTAFEAAQKRFKRQNRKIRIPLTYHASSMPVPSASLGIDGGM